MIMNQKIYDSRKYKKHKTLVKPFIDQSDSHKKSSMIYMLIFVLCVVYCIIIYS